LEPSHPLGDADTERFPACRLEREFGRPSRDWVIDDLVQLVTARQLQVVSLMHVGSDGWIKTLDFVPRSLSHLRDVLEAGERADGSSIFAGTGIRPGASDILLRPRVGSAFLDPFSQRPALAVLCSHAGRDGAPLPESPDTIVRRAAERVERELGVSLWALGEVEYFLGRHAHEEDDYGAAERGYHASSPFVFGEALRRDAMAVLAEIGVPIKYGHSEVGYIPAGAGEDTIWEQHEIEMALAPLADAADHVVLTQWVLRNLAHRAGKRCNFSPIMRKGHAGSGLHVHLSPRRGELHLGGRAEPAAGRSDAATAEELVAGLTSEARWLIAGLVSAAGALMAFGNRAEGSFIRLSQGKEAPTAVAWGEFDRLALVRLPVVATAPDGRTISPPTIEFRLPDGSAHPHLLLAGIAQALIAGSKIERVEQLLAATNSRVVRSESATAPRLPRGSHDVADALNTARGWLELGGVFSRALIDRLVESLRR
jgi:glutamine synthetase